MNRGARLCPQEAEDVVPLQSGAVKTPSLGLYSPLLLFSASLSAWPCARPQADWGPVTGSLTGSLGELTAPWRPLCPDPSYIWETGVASSDLSQSRGLWPQGPSSSIHRILPVGCRTLHFNLPGDRQCHLVSRSLRNSIAWLHHWQNSPKPSSPAPDRVACANTRKGSTCPSGSGPVSFSSEYQGGYHREKDS